MSAPATDPWEAAYLRFETPEQEIRKFTKRLLRAGAASWQRDSAIAELFCGRGSGLEALSRLGFAKLTGIDLSPRLIAQYKGPARCTVADCRQVPLPAQSLDAIIQGGLHHLLQLPDDLEMTLREARRLLRNQGRIVIVEPWLTPFLSIVHSVCRSLIARKMSNKLDALQTMIEHERATYENWLSRPHEILQIIDRYFQPERREMNWGKLFFVGQPR